MAYFHLVSGTTDKLQFQLLEQGAAIDLSLSTVALILSDRDGTTVASPGTVTVEDATNGKVSLTPTDANVFVDTKSPYSARWQITGAGSKISFVPSDLRDIWIVNAK